MRIEELETFTAGTRFETAVCIVGSGPVGLTLAAELARARIDVLVLESGGRRPSPFTDSLNRVESVGHPRVADQSLVRSRGLGGTSRIWSGRIAALDEVDFESRSWVPGSGWPIGRDEIARCFRRTLSHLGARVVDNVDPAFVGCVLDGSSAVRFDGGPLRDYFWSYSRDAARPADFMRFGTRADVSGIPGVRCLLNATVIHVDTNPEGTASTGVEVRGQDGLVRSVTAQATVLCAGGIENARLLLASDRVLACGVGNGHDQVGRYLMDHPRGPVASFSPEDFAAAQRRFSSYRVVNDGVGTVLTPGVALTRRVQEQNRLLNCAAWLTGIVDPSDVFVACRRLARFEKNPLRHAGHVLLGSGLALKAAARVAWARRGPVRRLSALHLECIVEQVPRADSRLTLASQVDAHGVPLARIDWKVGEAEARTVRAMVALFRSEAKRLGLPIPAPIAGVADEGSPLNLYDVAHPIGTTRMSIDPSMGVVDPACRVHGVHGLYIAGSSVFPTSGHANPTQTALALTIRLADSLIEGFKGGIAPAADRAGRGPCVRTTPVDTLHRRDLRAPRLEPLPMPRHDQSA